MKIIFGQGNPDRKYDQTRHNTGFMALEAFATAHDAVWKTDESRHARYAELTVGTEKVILIQPLSFYNETGGVARAYVDYYKLDPSQDLLVVHDDLALPFGTIRVRDRGSDAGNNGVKSLNLHLGETYGRIRIGIWSDGRERMDDVDFVLTKFTKEEQHKLEKHIIPHVCKLIESFVNGTLDLTSHSL